MLKSQRWKCTVIIMPTVLWFAVMVATSSVIAQTSRTGQEASFEDQFWKYLIGNNYKNWSPSPDAVAGFYKGQHPHGAYLKKYINRTAAGSIDDPSTGSVIILENYFQDKSLKSISVMYRSTGFNPSGNDWCWIEYQPDGSVVRSSATENKAAKGIHERGLAKFSQEGVIITASNCVQCHQTAAGNDFVFSNDRYSPTAQGVALKKTPKVKSETVDHIAGADDFFGSR